LRPIFHSRRYVDTHAAESLFPPGAATVTAGLPDYSPVAVTAIAHHSIHESAEDALMYAAHFAYPVAVRTFRRVCAGFATIAFAPGTSLSSHNLDGFLTAKRCFFESDLHMAMEIRPLPRCSLPHMCRATEEGIEDVTETGHQVIETIETASVAQVADTVIPGASTGITQHFIGLVDFLESLRRAFLIVVIRVTLESKPPEGSLNFLGAGVPGYSQQSVVVFLDSHLACVHISG
jgi:hypothetical protein